MSIPPVVLFTETKSLSFSSCKFADVLLAVRWAELRLAETERINAAWRRIVRKWNRVQSLTDNKQWESLMPRYMYDLVP